MTDNEIIEQLKDKNPFLSGASPLPWDNSNPDLVQLSREISEEIEQLMRHKRREPVLPLAGLILGAPGSGKTHMLTRILRKLKSSGGKAIFVTVKTFIDSKTITRHLLSEIFISLNQIHSNGRTQFDMLMNEFLTSYDEHRRSDDFNHTDDVKANIPKYLSLDIRGIDKNFVKALIVYMKYMNDEDPTKKADVLAWIQEGLSDEDSMSLGLPPRNLSEMSDERLEEEAEKTLINLGKILEYSHVLMILCFDQLERLKDASLVSPWGNIIHLLMNNLSGILPLCFVSTETWNTIETVLDDSVLHRLINNTMTMKTCTIEQAKQLIFAKLKAAFNDDVKAEECYKFLISRMGGSIKQGYSPRVVIELANEAIRNLKKIEITEPLPPYDDKAKIFETVKNAYEDEYKKIQSEPDSWPPDTAQLTLALQIWLEALREIVYSSSDLKSIKLTGTFVKNNKTFAFIIMTARNNMILSAGVKAGIKFINENPESFVCYITESSVLKSTYRVTNSLLDEFQNLGGRVIILDENSRLTWYALVALINRIDNGDVNLYLQSGNRTATRDDIQEFVKSLNLLIFKDPNPIVKTLKSIVKASPMEIIDLSKLTDLVRQKNIQIDDAKILSIVQSNKDIFKVLKPKNGELLISLVQK